MTFSRTLLAAFSPVLFASIASAQLDILLDLTDPAGSLTFGGEVVGGADFNLDGFDDILVGEATAGTVQQFLGGPPGGPVGTPGLLVFGLFPADSFGSTIELAGDIFPAGAPDGFVDYFVGAPNSAGGGYVQLINGLTGAVLTTFPNLTEAAVGPASVIVPGDGFGTSVELIGDLDGDTIPEIAIGAPAGGSAARGYVNIYAGAGGNPLLFTLVAAGGSFGFPIPALTDFGFDITTVADLGGDGVDDLLIGNPIDNMPGAAPPLTVSPGAAYLFACTPPGMGGPNAPTLIRKVYNDLTTQEGFGFSVGSPGDVTGDGVADILIAKNENGNQVTAVSGASLLGGPAAIPTRGTRLYTVRGEEADGLGNWLEVVPDADGDGVADFMTQAYFDTPNGMSSGSVRLLSGASGALLRVFNGDTAGDLWGSGRTGSAGDFDGDGIDDFIAASSSIGTVRVYPGRTLALTAGATTLSSSTGGVIDFFIDAADAPASSIYLILGSASGTFGTPTSTFLGTPIPLVRDSYFDALYLMALQQPTTMLFGFLNSLGGTATASVPFPPGLALSFGTNLHHAVVLGRPGQLIDLVSDPYPLTLVP